MSANPYEAPQARVADIEQEGDYQAVNVWSSRGRIGRLRYLAYNVGSSIVLGCISAGLTAALGPTAGETASLVAYIPFIMFAILLGIQRSHDMDWNGWTVLLSLIPLVGLIWLFKGGTRGPNTYGNPPPPNTTGIKIVAFLFPAIAVLGIIAAIAIPALQSD